MPQKKFIHSLELTDEQVSFLKNAYTANNSNSTLEIHREPGKTVTTILAGNQNDLITGCFFVGWLFAVILLPEGYPMPKPI